jgi:hypothetical protein
VTSGCRWRQVTLRLTTADERAYTAYAESERHKGFEVIDVDFEQTTDAEQRNA